jgi:hypothetical protein
VVHDLRIFPGLVDRARDERLQLRNVGHKLTNRFKVARVRDDRREYLDVFELIPSRLNPWFFGNDRRHCWILSGQPLMPPGRIREMHKRLVLQYLVASTESFQSSRLKPGKTKSGLCAFVSADNFGPVCVAWRKERRFE